MRQKKQIRQTNIGLKIFISTTNRNQNLGVSQVIKVVSAPNVSFFF